MSLENMMVTVIAADVNIMFNNMFTLNSFSSNSIVLSYPFFVAHIEETTCDCFCVLIMFMRFRQ